MIGVKVIEPATTERAAPIVVEPNKDGSLRFRDDYRSLNAKTIRDSYAFPHMQDCNDSLGVGTVFSTVDENSAY